MASDDEVPGAAAEPGRTSHRSLGGLPSAVITEERSEKREEREEVEREEEKRKKFPEADQAVSRIEMNGRLISALLGLFAQPKPRPTYFLRRPPSMQRSRSYIKWHNFAA